VGIDVPDGHGCPGREPGPGRSLIGEVTGAATEIGQRVVHLPHEVREGRVETGEELPARTVAVLVEALVAGGAHVAGLSPAQLPGHPVGRLDPAVGPGVDLRVFLEQLQPLRELPLGRDTPAVARQPRFVAPLGERVDPVGVGLRRMVLPELDVGTSASASAGALLQPAIRR
jgi:hypothetical protein